MGVGGLWDILRPAAQVRSLTHLSVVEGFEPNRDGHRGLRVGIDASIWFFHSAWSVEGENPELRMMLFRCIKLMGMPFLPLFVFDGPKRPKVKRGHSISPGRENWMVKETESLLKACGFEYRQAPGEAEAELAYLNHIGVIDAIISDDGDTFLFGGRMIIRNFSATLSGNKAISLKNSAGKLDENHAVIYRAQDIENHTEISLTRGGLILIGILRGGDYDPAGLRGCGAITAHGLARCGFGDELLDAARNFSRDDFQEVFLPQWRDRLRQEMRTNSRGFLPRKCPTLAKSMPQDFPDPQVILLYTNPITSETVGKTARDFNLKWEREPDIGQMATFCELHFEWGYKDMILKRFRSKLWPAIVFRVLRRAALLTEKAHRLPIAYSDREQPRTPQKKSPEYPVEIGSPSKMVAKHFSSLTLDSPSGRNSEDDTDLIVKIHSSRSHASTDGILELRLEIAPAHLASLAAGGVKGDRSAPTTSLDHPDDEKFWSDEDAPKGKRTEFPDPSDPLRVWMPACVVKLAHPTMVAEFEEMQQRKKDKRAGKSTAAKSRGGKAAPRKSTNHTKSLDVDTFELEPSAPAPVEVAPLRAPTTKGPTKPKPKQQRQEPRQPSSQGSQPKDVPGFFKATKTTAVPKAKTSSTSTSRVAALFKDLDAIFEMSQSQANTGEKGYVSKASVPSGSRRHPKEGSRSQMTTISRPRSTLGDTSRPTSPSKCEARPFPLAFDLSDSDDALSSVRHPPRTTTKTTPTKHKRQDSSSADPDSSKLQKSPRRSHSRGSPHSSGSTPRKVGSTSSTPVRPKIPSLQTHATGPSNQTIIVISSDSESGSDVESDTSFTFLKKSPQRLLSKVPLKTLAQIKRVPLTTEDDIIDLT